MVTTTSRQTEISGTRVRIVTFERAHSRAIAIAAHVVGRAFVQVIAQYTRVDMETAVCGVTGVYGARVPVATSQNEPGGTGLVGATVTHCAYGAVLARSCVGIMPAALVWRTIVIRTRIFVVTLQPIGGDAYSALASFISGARVQVIAARRVVLVGATLQGMAAIIRACVIIIALELCAVFARFVGTNIPKRADVSIFAGRVVRDVDTSRIRIAGVVSTDLGVVASQRSADAQSIGTCVCCGA